MLICLALLISGLSKIFNEVQKKEECNQEAAKEGQLKA